MRIAVVRKLLGGIVLLDLDRARLERAGTLLTLDLRSLDALHVVAARSLGADLAELITYDAQMAVAVPAQGPVVASPS